MSVDRGDCQTMVGMTYEKHGFQAWSQQEAQLSQKDRAMLYVIEYFAKTSHSMLLNPVVDPV